MMDPEGKILFIILLGLFFISFTNAQSQSCPFITIHDLGNTTEFSTNGLVARAIVPASQPSVPVRIITFTIVCDASGDRINTSSYVSVVVELQCNFTSASTNHASTVAVCNGSTIVTRQYQFQCIDQNGRPVWDTIVSGSNQFVQTLNPTATLSTPLANQCRRCIDDLQSSRADPTTHCDSCPSRCDRGLGRCYLGETVDECCNFYFQDNCTAVCPSALVNDSNSNCVCPALTLADGTVSYSMVMGVERNVGSVATHHCVSGYGLVSQNGENTRTCNINGWSGEEFMCTTDCSPALQDSNCMGCGFNSSGFPICTLCKGGYKRDQDGTECEKEAGNNIMLIIIIAVPSTVGVLIIIMIVIIISALVLHFRNKSHSTTSMKDNLRSPQSKVKDSEL